MGDHHILGWRRGRGEKMKVGVEVIKRESRLTQAHGCWVDYLTQG